MRLISAARCLRRLRRFRCLRCTRRLRRTCRAFCSGGLLGNRIPGRRDGWLRYGGLITQTQVLALHLTEEDAADDHAGNPVGHHDLPAHLGVTATGLAPLQDPFELAIRAGVRDIRARHDIRTNLLASGDLADFERSTISILAIGRSIAVFINAIVANRFGLRAGRLGRGVCRRVRP